MNKKEANILLISTSKDSYELLSNNGYKNIYWVPSILKATKYFTNNSEELKKYDIVLLETEPNHCPEIAGKINREICKLTEIIKKNTYLMSFEPLNCEYPQERKYFIYAPFSYGTPLNEEHFFSVLDELIPKNLKNQNINFTFALKKAKKLPKNKKEVKILFLVEKTEEVLAEHFFKENGFTDVTFRSSLTKDLEIMATYDLVIASGFGCMGLTSLASEYSGLLKGTDHAVCLIRYNISGVCSETKPIQIESIMTSTTKNVNKVNYYTAEDEEERYKDLLGCILNIYASYNPSINISSYPNHDALNLKFKNMHPEEAKSLEKYREENEVCEEVTKTAAKTAKEIALSDKEKHAISMLTTIQNFAWEYASLVTESIEEKSMPGLKVNLIKDAVNVSFMLNNSVVASITFFNAKPILNNYFEFYLETLSDKGKLSDMKLRSYYPDAYFSDEPTPEKVSEIELQRIQGIYTKVVKYLAPEVARMQKLKKDESYSLKRNSYFY